MGLCICVEMPRCLRQRSLSLTPRSRRIGSRFVEFVDLRAGLEVPYLLACFDNVAIGAEYLYARLKYRAHIALHQALTVVES
jgi:hypothetical protein